MMTEPSLRSIARQTGATIRGRKDDLIKEFASESILVKMQTRRALAAIARWTGAAVTPGLLKGGRRQGLGA